MAQEKNRVVITGIGSILPNAYSVEEFWNKIKEGDSQIDFIKSFSTDNFPIKIAAELKDFDYKKFQFYCASTSFYFLLVTISRVLAQQQELR